MDIETELQEATGTVQKKGEKTQAYLYRLTNAISELSDEDWSSLSESAQEWANEAIESVSNKEIVAEFTLAVEETTKEAEEVTEEEVAEEAEEEEEEEAEEEPELVEEQLSEEEEEDIIEEPEVETAEEDEEEMLNANSRTNSRIKPVVKKAGKDKTATRNKVAKPVVKPVAKPVAKLATRKVTKATSVAATPKRRTSANELVRQLVTKNPKITKEQLIQKVKEAGHDHLREGTIISWRYVILQIIRTQTALGLLKNS